MNPRHKNDAVATNSGYRDETDEAGRHGYNYTTDEATKAIKELNNTDRLNTMKVHGSCPSWMRQWK